MEGKLFTLTIAAAATAGAGLAVGAADAFLPVLFGADHIKRRKPQNGSKNADNNHILYHIAYFLALRA